MNRFTKIAVLLSLVAGLAGACFGQTALTQTTLASAVNGPALYSGTTPTISGTVTLASCTGLAAPVLPGTPSSIIYVGREAMGVFSVNTTSCILVVNRGYMGTQAAPHPSGDMVLYGPNYANTIAFGGNPVPNGLFQQDPPANGTCTATGTPTSPWVNVLTGAQWICSTISKTWIPGFVNPLTTVTDVPNTAVASAGTILPTGPLFHLTGTTAVTTITTPVGCDATAVGGCTFSMIVDSGTASQFGTGGNLEIGAAITTLSGKTYTFVWDAVQSKWSISG
jgi:hypothetical protein